jgi:hypothetical protein
MSGNRGFKAKIGTMFKYILEGAGNYNWMAIFALLTFMIMFTVSVVVIFIQDKKHISYMAHLPLEDDDPTDSPQ